MLHSVDDIENVFCISMAFDGLAAETQFIRKILIPFTIQKTSIPKQESL